MKVKWNKLDSTKMVELNYKLLKENLNIRIPTNLKDAIVKINCVVSQDNFNKDIIDIIIEKVKKQNPLLVIIGTITIKREKSEIEERKLPLSLSRKELIKEFIKKNAHKDLRKKISKRVKKIMEITNES